GWILGRTIAGSPANGRQFLPENARAFPDMGAYITSAASLFVYSGIGRQEAENSKRKDPNRGHWIYDNEVKNEIVDYGYMLHRRTLEQAEGTASVDHAAEARIALSQLMAGMRDAAVHGEIRDLLTSAWEALGVPELRDRAKELLSINEGLARVYEGRRANRWRTSITILLSVASLPTVGQKVLGPLFEWLGLWLPSTNASRAVYLITVAGLIVSGGLLALYRLVQRP
ncbi:hypothetical protein ACFL6C_04120, partial [Myxococcota bacterium]